MAHVARSAQPVRRLKLWRARPIPGTMSLEAVIGRIDQIQQLQEQMFDPAVSSTGGVGLSPSSSTTPTTSTSATSATAQTDFASALANAQATPATASVAAAASAPAAVQSMVTEANSLLGKPYVWGGGHSGWGAQSGYDCSGFVSAVLHAGGYLSTPQDTQTLPSAAGIESGPGQYVTIYDRTDAAGASSDHVIINLGGQFYESGGESGSWGGGGGVQAIATPTAAYLSTFNQILHPAGL